MRWGFSPGRFSLPPRFAVSAPIACLALACLLASPLGGRGWTSSEAIWLLIRVAGGFSFAVMFAATDTAVLDTAPVGSRSRAIGIYAMFERLAMMIMPFAFAGRLAGNPPVPKPEMRSVSGLVFDISLRVMRYSRKVMFIAFSA